MLGWDQKKYENIPAPSIDSETGRMDTISPEKIIHEVPEHSCYLMQTIRIGSSEALVFFDRGANIHIIDGSLAEKEGLQKVSSNPTNLTVVGGSKVRSNHGTFRFNLGPGERGEYHEVVCVGMDDVTGGFGTYDLMEVCQEYLDQAKDEEKDLALPEKVGGSKVHLLLGIKNTNLDPVLIKVLPSGVAVYLSPFKNVYGSRFIFAGPHRSFTKGSDEKYSEMSNAVFLIRERILEDMNDEVEQRCYAITTNEKLGLTVNPHPINEEDIIDCNGEVEDDFESSLDDHQRLSSILEHQGKVCKVHIELKTRKSFQQIIKEQINLGSVSGPAGECSSPVRESNTALGEDGADQDMQPGSVVVNMVECTSPDRVLSTALDKSISEENYGVFKGKVPMAKFRNAMDDEDSEEGGGFRCAECSKCLNCKTSSKRTEPPLGFAALAARAGRSVAELLVDPVFHGWMKALRITGYMQGWKTSYFHSKHLIQDEKCRICVLGDHRWDPRNETEKAEQYFFSWESERVERTLKPTEM